MKKKVINPVIKYTILFLIGYCVYIAMEVTTRGRSHWTMGLLGGIAFIAIGRLNNWIPWHISLIKQGIIGSVVITALELICGLICNVWLSMSIWDYSNIPLNFMGQICLPFSLLWIILSIVAVVIDDYLRYLMFDEEMPKYYLFTQKKE